MKFKLIQPEPTATEKEAEVRVTVSRSGSLDITINQYAVLSINPEGELIRFRNVNESTGLSVDMDGRIKEYRPKR